MMGQQALRGSAVLAGCWVLAIALRELVPLPIPVPLWGMALLFALFLILGRVPADIRLVGEFLLHHMPLFFVPAILGVLAYQDLLRLDGVALSVALVVSTLIGLIVTAGLFRFLDPRPSADPRASDPRASDPRESDQ